MPESYRTGSPIETKPLWQIYYPDRDLTRRYSFNMTLIFRKILYLVKGKSAQHDTNNQNGNIISKEKSTDDIEVIMLNKQVRKQKFLSFHRSFFF
jgi:hypothetical protein